ncbi:MAG TPA: hypothetical protein VL633_01170 [Bacteroidota bacterium]|jgi:hypothetical protein|nr:hypothetical protein [Bacteroidota bacterium]
MKLTLVVLFLMIVGAGCSEDPNLVGLGVLPPQDTLHVATATTFATGDTTFLSRVTGGSSTLLFGNYQTLEARSLLAFSQFSATIPSTAAIDSAVITFKINYRFRDSSGTVGIEAHRFSRAFATTGFNWDSASVSGSYSDTVSGALLQTITSSDTVIRLRIDTTTIRQWISSDIGRLILLPTGNFITGFTAYNATTLVIGPQLTIFYNDSLNKAFNTAAALCVANGTIPSAPGRVSLQAGVAYRGVLRFDSLSIPARVSVTQAILEVPVDTAASLTNSYTDDRIIAHLVRKSAFPFDSLALATTCTPAYEGLQKVYRADIKAIVQQWLLKEPNNGLVIRASGELSTFDRLLVYGASAPAGLRPKITVTYTALP